MPIAIRSHDGVRGMVGLVGPSRADLKSIEDALLRSRRELEDAEASLTRIELKICGIQWSIGMLERARLTCSLKCEPHR